MRTDLSDDLFMEIVERKHKLFKSFNNVCSNNAIVAAWLVTEEAADSVEFEVRLNEYTLAECIQFCQNLLYHGIFNSWAVSFSIDNNVLMVSFTSSIV